MSALDDLKDRIDSAIYTNTEQNITGDGLQTVLDDMVDTMGVSVSQNTETGHIDIEVGDNITEVVSIDDLKKGSLWKGNATPQTSPTGITSEDRVMFLATVAGTYTNFLGENSTPLVVNDGEIAVLYWTGSLWVKSSLSYFTSLSRYKGNILYNASHTYEGIQSKTLNGISVDDLVVIKFDAQGTFTLNVSYNTSGGHKRLGSITDNKYHIFYIPNDRSDNSLYITHTTSDTITGNLYVSINPLLESIKSLKNESAILSQDIADVADKEVLNAIQDKGWNATTSVPTNSDEKKVISAVLDIKFLNEQNIGGIFSFRMLTYLTNDATYGNHLHLTIWDGSTTYPVKFRVSDKTGIKTYSADGYNKDYVHAQITIDWSKYDDTQWGSTDEGLKLISNYFDSFVYDVTQNELNKMESVPTPMLNTDISASSFGVKIPNAGAVTINKSIDVDSQIRVIEAKVEIAGDYQFSIGFVDQRKMLVVRTSFVLSLGAGYNKKEVSIPIYAGEMLFLHCSASNGSKVVYYNSSYTNGLMYYGQGTDVVANFVTLTNSAPAFSYSLVSETEHLFAYETALKEANEKIDSVQASIPIVPKNVVLSSPDGTKWKLIVNNSGVVSSKSPYYKSIISIGNSLTKHPTSENWFGSWGMAASIKDNDYLHIVAAKNNEYVEVEYVDGTASTAWETATDSATRRAFLTSTVKPLFDNAPIPVDCVILKVSDNITTDAMRATLLEDYKELIAYCRTQSPDADIYGMSCYYVRPQTDAILKQACEEMGVPFIWDLKSSLIDSDTFEGAWVMGDDDELHLVAIEAVAGHPSDFGHYQIANLILAAMGLDASSLAHKVTVNSSLPYTAKPYWVENGIYSFKCDDASSILVKDSNDITITATQQSNGVWTFVMPDNDVTITVS